MKETTIKCDACGSVIEALYDSPGLTKRTYSKHKGKTYDNEIHVCIDCHGLGRDCDGVRATLFIENGTGDVLIVKVERAIAAGWYAPENAPEPYDGLVELYNEEVR